MLSAIAARKARLAQSQSQAQSTTPTASAPSTSASPPPSETKKTAAALPDNQKAPSSKRKSSTAAASSIAKKKQKRSEQQQRRPPAQPARYFVRMDAFETQEDVIVDDDESDGGSSVSSHGTPFAKDGALPGGALRKRAWSPSAPLPDSSDEEEDEYEEGEEPIVLDFPLAAPLAQAPSYSPSESALSTFDPVLNQNVFHLAPGECTVGDLTRKSTVFLLRSGDTVALLGTYTLAVLLGTVSLAGVQLMPSPTSHPVYAPRSSPLPLIQCGHSRPTSSSTRLALPSLPERIANFDYDAVVVLQELHTGIEGLGRVCRTFDGCFAPARWHRDQARFDLGLDTVYFLERQTPDVTPLVVPPSWDAAISSVVPLAKVDEYGLAGEGVVYLVRGPKNAGKSTFARLLLDRLLLRFRQVVYMECDLGQSEFTPGGMVSLNVVQQPVFGPPFSHPSVPRAAHYVGATSPKNAPSHYLDSIHALVQLYRTDLQYAVLDEDDAATIPLVVNTMGWTKGLGADLGRKVEDIVEPTHVFSFAPPEPGDEGRSYAHLESGRRPGGATLHTVESVPSSALSSYYTAADHRNIALLSYFHAVFPSPSLSERESHTSLIAIRWNTALPLCAQPPYELDCTTALDKLVLSGAGAEDVVPEEVHRALPCALVALVRCDTDTDSDTDTTRQRANGLPYERGDGPPMPHASRCVGLALVRGVSDPRAQMQLQILTPVPPHLLGDARVLVMGEMQLPIWGMLDFRTLEEGSEVAGVERGRVPFLRWGKGGGVGGERRRVRRNLMRRGQV